MPYSNPDRERKYQRQYCRTRRAGDRWTTPVHRVIPIPFRLQTAQDVIDLLQEQISAVRGETNAGTLEKARTVADLASIALKAIETGHLAARIEMLESVLKRREKGDES